MFHPISRLLQSLLSRQICQDEDGERVCHLLKIKRMTKIRYDLVAEDQAKIDWQHEILLHTWISPPNLLYLRRKKKKFLKLNYLRMNPKNLHMNSVWHKRDRKVVVYQRCLAMLSHSRIRRLSLQQSLNRGMTQNHKLQLSLSLTTILCQKNQTKKARKTSSSQFYRLRLSR